MESDPSSLLNTELLATCNALGYLEKGKYHKDPECLESLKDLIRFLRRDDEAHEVRRQLGAISIVETDLLPIIKEYSQENEIFDVTLRLLVNLTNPALLLYKEELPEEKVSRNYYLQCVGYLQKFKKTFADSRVWTVLSKKLQALLEQDLENKDEEEDNIVIERILILLRNVLHVPSNPEEEKRTDDDVSIHDQVIWALHASGMSDLILFIAANENQESFSFHVMEIIFHMLREQEPEQLACAGQNRPQAEKEKDILALAEILARERAQKISAITPSRHSRFGGTYCVKNVKSVSDNDVICHKPLQSIESLNFDANKKVRRVAKNRRPMEDISISRRSTLSIRLFLKEFCVDFLDNAYNNFMAVVKDHLTKHRAQDHDESYYLWALHFFMKFSRLHRLDISRVSETVSKQCFHYIHTQIENYIEMMMTDKKAMKRWSRRAHLALRAYQELITTLASMIASKDKKTSESGKIIAGTIFYLMEYRDLLLHLLNVFDPVKYPKSYLKDLVETTHTFLKVLELFCGQHRHMSVEVKKRKNIKRKKAEKNAEKETNLDEIWDTLANDISALLKGSEEIPKDILPFDAASEIDFEEQKKTALIKIQDALREKRPGEAVALFRASRELWPDGEVFGSANEKPEVEYLLLREIHFTDLPRTAATAIPVVTDVQEDGDSLNEEEEEEELSHVQISEQEFSFSDFMKRFAGQKVVAALGLLLSSYQQNGPQTNHSLLKLMHRVAWDLKMYGLFFQASIFRSFQKILAEPALNISPTIKELARFATFIIRKFFEAAEKNKKVFAEMLFWKNAKEVYEIQEGYGTQQKTAGGKVTWTEEQDEELKILFDQFKDHREDGLDVIDKIVTNMIDQSKTRKQVIRQLKSLNVITDAKQYRRKAVSVASKQWREEEIENLRALFYKNRSAMDILSRITEGLLLKKSKKSVADKLLELGLVHDRKELRKKLFKGQENLDDPDDNLAGSDASDVGGDSSDSEDDTPGQQSSGTNRRSSEQRLDISALKSAVEKVVTEDLQPALQWLQDTLESEAEDREADEDWDSVPLVPLMEEQSNAMNNDSFKQLLLAVGVVPPANEQESFWRIPSTLSPSQLRERKELIGKAQRGELVNSELNNSLGECLELSREDDATGSVSRPALFSDSENEELEGSIQSGLNSSSRKNAPPKPRAKRQDFPSPIKQYANATSSIDDFEDNPSGSSTTSKLPKTRKKRFPSDDVASQSTGGIDSEEDLLAASKIYTSKSRAFSQLKSKTKRSFQRDGTSKSDSDQVTPLSMITGKSGDVSPGAKSSTSKRNKTKKVRKAAILSDSDDDVTLSSKLPSPKSAIDTISKKPRRVVVMSESDDDVVSDVISREVDVLAEESILSEKSRRAVVMSDSDDDVVSEVTSSRTAKPGVSKPRRSGVIEDSDDEVVSKVSSLDDVRALSGKQQRAASDIEDDTPLSLNRNKELTSRDIQRDNKKQRKSMVIADSEDELDLLEVTPSESEIIKAVSDSDDNVPLSVSRKVQSGKRERNLFVALDSDEDTPLAVQKKMTSCDVTNRSEMDRCNATGDGKASISVLDSEDDVPLSFKGKNAGDQSRDAGRDVDMVVSASDSEDDVPLSFKAMIVGSDVVAARDVSSDAVTASDVASDADRKPVMKEHREKTNGMKNWENSGVKRHLSARKRRFPDDALLDDGLPLVKKSPASISSPTVQSVALLDSDCEVDKQNNHSKTKRARMCILDSDDE